MTDAGLTETQRMVQQSFRRFVAERVTPVAGALDEAAVFPAELFAEVGRLGFFGLRYPEAVGGSGADRLSYCVAVEALARGSLSLAAACAMQSLMGTYFVYRSRNKTLLENYLGPALTGERIGGICMTEPDAGSDLGAMGTRALLREDGTWCLTGHKTWVTSGSVAHFFSVFAKVPAAGEGALGCFLVDHDAPGLALGRDIQKLGVRASPTCELHLEDVPARAVLVPPGEGLAALQEVLVEIRLMTAALGLGVGRAALEDAIAYARERVAFGRPIYKHAPVSDLLADSATELNAARAFTWHAANLAEAGACSAGLASQVKLFATEASLRACDRAFRVLASYGYANEYSIQRYLRDVRFTLVGGGTSEILRMIIGRELMR